MIMETILNNLADWPQKIKSNPVAKWSELPDIELYMDQVITYIEKQLSVYQEEEEGKLITSSMINNYVKDGVIKHAVSKKYSKEHLASLIMIGLLKQVLPLSQISKITGTFNESENKENIYNTFIQIQSDAFSGVLKSLEGIEKESGGEQLLFTAVRLSCEAFAYRIAAERIFKMIKGNNYVKEKKKKEETKYKEKKEKNKHYIKEERI